MTGYGAASTGRNAPRPSRHLSDRLWSGRVDQLYVHLKADSSQTLDLQHNALLAAGVEPRHFYEHQASGKDLRFVDRQSFFAHSSRYAAIVDMGGGAP